VTFTEYPIPTGGGRPYGITKGPDGNLWFTEFNSNKIGRITPAGMITEFPVLGAGNPVDITAGPDGNLWFTEYSGDKIRRITPAGVITEFPIPSGNSFTYGIAAGPDGNLWSAEIGTGIIGRITPSGLITEYPIPTSNSDPIQIASGPDGNLWFTEGTPNKIGRITTGGAITEFLVPTAGALPYPIIAGPDDSLWFAEYHGAKIGRIATTGVITEFPIPSSFVSGLTVGSDGNLWYVGSGNIGRITLGGFVTEFPVPNSGSPVEITMGPDGNLWFTDQGSNSIGKINIGCSPPAISAAAPNPSVLWPPNHKMIPVNMSATTSGGCGAVLCQITSVSSNEPVDPDGDWVITGNLTLALRAERLGDGTGRVYTITVQCTDGSGKSMIKTASVSVLHEQSLQ
jgi:streptogramin lyase